MKVFLDTSAFIALNFAEDAKHLDALSKQEILNRRKALIFTSNAVLYETLTWFGVKLGADKAEVFGRRLWTESLEIKVLELDREDELGALAVMTKHSTIRLSFVDASNIQLIRKHGMDRIFAFDRHFEQAGLAVL